MLGALLAATCLTELPATAAAALVASAVVVHWAQRGRIHWLGWRLPGMAVLAALLWGRKCCRSGSSTGWPWS